MTACIRAATVEDVPEIVAIERVTASAAHWSASLYETRAREGHLLVAERDGTICGFLCAQVVAGEWEIENIVVSESARRRAIASDMLSALLERWRAGGGTKVLLEVRDSNLAARRLYEKHGFREAGRRRSYYENPPEDAIVYSLGS